MPTPKVRLRRDLPFRRIAVVLSGGGALGAYEVGVLRVLESVGLRPVIVAGVSIGAVNAVVWLAHQFGTFALERTWRRLRAATIGLRWVTLAWRGIGAFVVLLALLELLILVTGSRELSGAYWFWGRSSGRIDLLSTLFEAAAWVGLGALGVAALLLSRQAERWFASAGAARDPERSGRIFGRVLLALLVLHATAWAFGWPWPHRFMAIALLAMGLVWLANRPGRAGRGVRDLLKRVLPETAGRGLWSAAARRRVIEELMRTPTAERVMTGDTRLIVSALAIDTGQVCHFINWKDPEPEFAQRVATALGEVIPMRDLEDVVRATLASSAIPGIFEPVRIAGRDFVDAGGFANQPLHVAIAAGADAALVVLLSPSGAPSPAAPPGDLFELAGRLLEIANWRDMQTELRNLPPGWSRDGTPAQLCVVEPEGPLPGVVLGFDPPRTAELIALGDHDARRALERAGWLENVPAAAPATADAADAAAITAAAPADAATATVEPPDSIV